MSAKKGGSKQTTDGATYDVRDTVLAKVRGYPPWPGMVVNPESVPANVTKERPQSKKTTFYCVRFFPTGDYAWALPKDMSKLQKHEIEAYINEPFRKNGELLKGYKVALDPTKWEEEREQVLEQEEDAEVDQLDEGEEEEGGAPGKKKKAAASKKRKRDSEPAAKKEPKAKAKAAKKEPAEKKKGAAKSKKSKAVVESEDEGAGDEEKSAPPPTKKSKREDEDDAALANDKEAQKVKNWRHTLQKAFLGKASPADDTMPDLDKLFTEVEQYDNMTIAYLQYSKIGKVMRHINQQDKIKIPRDDEFKFKERAQALVDKWQSVLNAHKANGTSKSEDKDDKDEKPAANGENGDVDMDAKANGTADEEDAKADDADEADADEAGAGDQSMLGDVTMSEAAA